MDRKLEQVLLKRLKSDRAIALLGPRQSGKSYLLKQAIKAVGGSYLSLDDPMIRAEIAPDPLGYLRRIYSSSQPLFIDEAARLPGIFEAIKILIDEKGSLPSGICLANSGNYLLMKHIKEHLAGRVSLLTLYPLSWQEMSNSKTEPGLFRLLPALAQFQPPKSYVDIDRSRTERLLWGGYPFPALASEIESRQRWAEDYLKTYVLPILLEQFNLRNIESFEKCARLLFIQSGQFLNYSLLAQETGISQPTAVNYVYQLKAMMLISLLERYFRNPKKRLLKQPKVHVADPLLLNLSLGTNFNLQKARERGWLGTIYESFIVFELIKTLENYGQLYQIFSWRTADKSEVDIILEFDGQVFPFEIKMSKRLNKRDTSGLRSFLADNLQVKNGYIIYPGDKIVEVEKRIFAIPDWWLLGAVSS